MIELNELQKVVNQEIHIHPINLTLKPGVFNVILGPTLSGKTTLMRLMAGLEDPTQGEIWLDGKDITQQSIQQRNVAMVYQQFINYPSLTVFENIASPLRLKKMKRSEIRERVHRMAKLLKIDAYLDRKIHELSGGQQQRIALARALVKEAKLVLLDEPLANLDYKLREEFRDELPKLFRDSGSVVVYATTEVLDALLLEGNTVVLHEGRVIQSGETEKCYRYPVNLRSAQAFSDPPINIFSVRKNRGKVILEDTITWAVPRKLQTLPDGDYTAGLRPYYLSLKKESRQVILLGKVNLSEITGSDTLLYFTHNQKTWIAHLHGVHLFKPGDKIQIYLRTDEVMYFDRDQNLVNQL